MPDDLGKYDHIEGSVEVEVVFHEVKVVEGNTLGIECIAVPGIEVGHLCSVPEKGARQQREMATSDVKQALAGTEELLETDERIPVALLPLPVVVLVLKKRLAQDPT